MLCAPKNCIPVVPCLFCAPAVSRSVLVVVFDGGWLCFCGVSVSVSDVVWHDVMWLVARCHVMSCVIMSCDVM